MVWDSSLIPFFFMWLSSFLSAINFFLQFFSCGPSKFFIEFVTILLLFYVLVFWLPAMWDLSSLTRDQTHALCIGRRSLNHWTSREVPSMPFIEETILSLICSLLPSYNCPYMFGCTSGLLILFHWSMYLFFCQYHAVLITMLCNIVWNQGVRYLQLCSFFSRLLWLFSIFCGFIYILEFFVSVM